MEYKLFFKKSDEAYFKERAVTDKELSQGWITIQAETKEQARRYAFDRFFKFWDCLHSEDEILDYEFDLANYPLGELERHMI